MFLWRNGRRLKLALTCLAGYWLCAGLLTWPLLRHLATHLPLGTESAATVPLFNLWTLRWNALQLRTGYPDYWDAPIFYPAQGALALSEPQPLTGILFALLDGLTQNQVLAYNLLLLLILAANALAAAAWLRRLGLERGPALLGGLLALSLPFVSNELGVIQLTVLFPLFLSLAALAALVRRADWGSAMALGGWTAATFLTCSYYGLFLTLFLPLGVILWGRRQFLTRQTAGRIALSVLFTAVLLLPVIPAQYRLTRTYHHATATITQNSAQPIDYLRLGSRAWGRDVLPWLQTGGGSGQRLYPGTGLLGLAGLGLWVAWRSGRRRWALFLILGAGVAAVFSLGLNLTIGGWQPYAWLRAVYPGWGQLRSPFRLGLWVQVCLLGLAGFGLGFVWRRRAPWGRLLTFGLVGLSIAELLAWPTRLSSAPVYQSAWVDWLARQPAGAVAMVPFPSNGRVVAYLPTVTAMLQGLTHKHPLANGYSGFFPLAYDRLRAVMQTFPDASSLASLRQTGVTYVVVDRDWLLTHLPAVALQLSEPMQLVFGDRAVFVYRFKPVERSAYSLAGRWSATRAAERP